MQFTREKTLAENVSMHSHRLFNAENSQGQQLNGLCRVRAAEGEKGACRAAVARFVKPLRPQLDSSGLKTVGATLRLILTRNRRQSHFVSRAHLQDNVPAFIVAVNVQF